MIERTTATKPSVRFDGRSRLGEILSKNRESVQNLVDSAGAGNVRVFGSVSRGIDGPGSDIDLLIDIPDTMDLFELAELQLALAKLLGVSVDVVPARGLTGIHRERILSEAVPL